MHISWLGLSAFKIETKEAVVVTDPYAPAVAERPLRAKADIVTVSRPASPAHGHVAAISGTPFVIDHPGEFEVRGVYVRGVDAGGGDLPSTADVAEAAAGSRAPTLRGKAPLTSTRGARKGMRSEGEKADRPPVPAQTVFTFDAEGMRLAHLGGVARAPASDVLEKLGDVDVLFVPVGGGSTLEPGEAMRVVNAIEPLAVIPMLFAEAGRQSAEKLLPVAAFLREIGASRVEPVERVSLKRRDLSEEETKVFLFRV